MSDPKDTIEGPRGNPAERAKEANIDDDGSDNGGHEGDKETRRDHKKRQQKIEQLLEHAEGNDTREQHPEDSAGAGVKGQTQPEDSQARMHEGLSTTVEERVLAGLYLALEADVNRLVRHVVLVWCYCRRCDNS